MQKSTFKIPEKSKKILLKELADTTEEFMLTAHAMHYDPKIYDIWTASDIVRHITFWHTYYLKTITSLAAHEKPLLLKGKFTELNAYGVTTMQKYGIDELLELFKETNSDLIKQLTLHTFPHIPYKENGRIYTTKQFIGIITSHIRNHTKALKKIKP